MREVVIHILILLGVPAIYGLAGTALNSIRGDLIGRAEKCGAKKHNPWLFAVAEFLLYRDLNRKGIVTWIINHLAKPQQPHVETKLYGFVFLGLMLLGLLVFFFRRKEHIAGEFLLGLARIPLDLVWLISFGMRAVVDKYPPELGYWHNIPKNYAQKMATTRRPVGASASGTGGSAGEGSSSSGGSEEPYTEQVVSEPIHVPEDYTEKYTESIFVPEGEYYSAKTADGQTVYYHDPENRPFVDGGLDEISHHEG